MLLNIVKLGFCRRQHFVKSFRQRWCETDSMGQSLKLIAFRLFFLHLYSSASEFLA